MTFGLTTIADRRDAAGGGLLRGMACLVAFLLVLVGILDVLSTNASLAAGNVETNPLVAALLRELGGWWFVPKLAVHVSLAVLVLWVPSRGMIRKAGAGIALYAAIIASNFHLAGWTI